MRNLNFFLIFYLSLFIKYSYPVMGFALKDLATNTSDDGAHRSSRTRTEDEFKYDGRIVGGFVTSIANYPYQVSLQYHNAHICGGSIVAHNIILTAAHCIEQPWDTAAFRVRAGSSTHLYGGQLVGVRHIFKHETYSSSTLDSDVALVVLNKNLTYTRTVQPVELATWGEQLPNEDNEFFVSGWGLTSETGLVSPLLNYVAVRLINQNTCSKNYQYIATISSKMFCAGYPQGGKDSCQGDSGGPLVSYVSSSLRLSSLLLTSTTKTDTKPALELQANALKPKQYGIVSWGMGCAQKSYPGVYANVAALRPWIDAKLREISYL
ncbi:trypsin delta [Lucilia sericata]|uniref:trypsin delta n=1 Tax=Lucilia sericata TaxID=13632 RepID=UPI0018A84875|nr:trypsin delta [Lucilia sericata]